MAETRGGLGVSVERGGDEKRRGECGVREGVRSCR